MYYAGDDLAFTQTCLRLTIPSVTSFLGLQMIPEGLQAATKPWINRIYSPAGRYQASSTTNIKKLKATFVPTFAVLSCFQFPALLSSCRFAFQNLLASFPTGTDRTTSFLKINLLNYSHSPECFLH
ncbi:hypothetical protein AMECASPLE_034485, partial [Ameca splendens]